MNKPLAWIVALAQLGLAGAWLMSGVAYVYAPAAMLTALGLSDAARLALGLMMGALGLLLLLSLLIRETGPFALSVISLSGVAAVAWLAYDLARHWEMFVLFHFALAAVAFAVLWVRMRVR